MNKKLEIRDDHALLLTKLSRIMRMMLLLFILGINTLLAASGYSQSTKITLKINNARVEEVLNKIESQSEFYFLFNQRAIDLNRIVTIDAKSEKIETILDEVFAGTDVKHQVIDRQIVLTTNAIINSQQETRKLSGKVTDNNGMALPGVSVIVKGTTQGVITDTNGNFNFNSISENATLVFTFVGMRSQEVLVKGQSSLKITLQEEAIGLNEVVAVGFATQKKVNMTGAVSAVKFDELNNSRPITNVSSALSGLSSGVTVRQSNGKPNSDGASIRIRGLGTLNNNDPLVIIDGMEGVLDAVNPQDIESISILKDAASASIYGSRAANGVVLVTTKKGSGKKLTVNYNGIFSIAQPAKLLGFVNDYATYMKLMNESARNISTAEVFSANTISAWEAAQKDPNALNANGVPNYVSFPNTNWNSEMYKTNLVQDHNISVNGSTQNSRFLLSAGYLDNPGVVNATGMKRYNVRANVEIDATDWLTVGTRTYASMNESQLGNYSNVLTYIYQTTPGVYPVYKGAYGYPEAPEESATANNIDAFLNTLNGFDRVNRFNTTLYSKVKFMKGLTWDVNFNYARRFDEYNNHTNPSAAVRVKFSTGTVMTPATVPSLQTTYFKSYSESNYVLENLLRYNTTIAEKHEITALAGYNETKFFNYDQNATKRGLFDPNAYVFNAATEMLSIGGTASDYAIRSYFGRLNYTFNQRYLFEANMRYDGSSRFQTDHRHGYFPSFSAGWRISEEKFMKDIHLFQNLKVRASWGKLGNNASGNYDYMALYGPVGYSFNGIQVTGLRSGKIPNPLLQWESTTVTNLGLDASILDGRLSAELDAYHKLTDGILTTVPLDPVLGLVSSPTMNTAEVLNKGIEATLNWKDKIGQVKYSVSANFGFNKNEVTGYKGKLVEEWRTDANGNPVYYSNLGDVSSGDLTRIIEGHPINEYYLMDLYHGNGNGFNQDGTVNINGGPRDGMIRTADDMNWLNAMITAGYKFMPNLTTGKNKIWYGDYIYADKNGDKIYGNSYDRKFVNASATPKFTFGSQMNVSWKNFDLNLIWSGMAGYKIYWLERGYNSSTTRIGFQIGEILANNHYYYNDANPTDIANNTTAKYPRLKLNESDSQNTQYSTRWLYNGSYLRLRNLTLGYTLPKQIARKIFTEQVRVYFSGENLFTITSFPGLDPEMGGNTNYPVFRQFAFGTNITF